MMEFLVEEWCRIPPIKFQTLVESLPRYIEAVLTRGGPTPYDTVGVTVNLAVTCIILLRTQMLQSGRESAH